MTDLTDDESLALGDAEAARGEFRRTEAAFDQVRASMLELIATSKIGEAVLREKLYMGISVLDQVKTALLTAASDVSMIGHDAKIRAILAGEDPDA